MEKQPGAAYVFVERSSVRRKADRTMRKFLNDSNDEYSTESTTGADRPQHSSVDSAHLETKLRHFSRVKADLSDLCLPRVRVLANEPVVAVAKHLCGAATDLALRALYYGTSSTENCAHDRCTFRDLLPIPLTGEYLPILEGICIATCCHHKCTWETYVGKEFWVNTLGLSPEDFEYICRITSWSISGFGRRHKQDEDREHGGINDDELDFEKFSAEKPAVGFKCKRLIDMGRLDFLRKWTSRHTDKHDTWSDAKLVQYCHPDTSPENVLLVASRARDKINDYNKASNFKT